MSDTARTPEFGFEDLDLDLGDLTVTAMRDTVALPEGGASSGSCSCQASSSCSKGDMETPFG